MGSYNTPQRYQSSTPASYNTPQSSSYKKLPLEATTHPPTTHLKATKGPLQPPTTPLKAPTPNPPPLKAPPQPPTTHLKATTPNLPTNPPQLKATEIKLLNLK